MNRILVFGATGLLGTEVVKVLKDRGRDLYTPGRAMYDFTSREALLNPFLENLPDDISHIVNCAGYTDVDGAEDGDEFSLVLDINAMALQSIADAAEKRDIPVLHVSTDYVFGGQGYAAYGEDDTPCPMNTYGWSKLAGERILQASDCKYAIVRTSWLYGETRPVFVNRVMQELLARRDVSAASDLIRVPTSAAYVASCIADLLLAEETGIFHCMAGGVSTPYEVAAAIHSMVWNGGPTAVIRPDLRRYAAGAPRPYDVRLDCSKLVEALGYDYIPHWREDLEKYVKSRLAYTPPGPTV